MKNITRLELSEIRTWEIDHTHPQSVVMTALIAGDRRETHLYMSRANIERLIETLQNIIAS